MADIERAEHQQGTEQTQLLQVRASQRSSPPSLQLGPFVTFRGPVAEISSLLSGMYIIEEDDDSADIEVHAGRVAAPIDDIKNTV